MNLPQYSVDDLNRLRLQECQGTMIGGMMAAIKLGQSAEEHGVQMMTLQQVDWSKADSAEKIASVFWQHYQTTYDFGDQLFVTEDDNSIVLVMPALAIAAEYQLRHWAATDTQLNNLQRGYWRAIKELCDVSSALVFTGQQHQVTIFR